MTEEHFTRTLDDLHANLDVLYKTLKKTENEIFTLEREVDELIASGTKPGEAPTISGLYYTKIPHLYFLYLSKVGLWSRIYLDGTVYSPVLEPVGNQLPLTRIDLEGLDGWGLG